AWIIASPPGADGVATIRPIRTRPLAVVVTGVLHGVALPAASPPVETSSCVQAILLVAGLNATSRNSDVEFGTAATLSWITLPTALMTGCWSAAGGASIALLWMLAHAYSSPVLWLKDGSGHSTPPVLVGETTTYCWSV